MFFISFSSTFLHCAVIYQQNYYLWLLHLKITTFGYHISKLLPLATTSQNFIYWLFHLKIYILIYCITQHQYQLPHWTL